MRRHALAILAAISLFGLGVFGCGYIAGFAARFQGSTSHRYVAVASDEACLSVARGYASVTIPSARMRIGSVEVYTDFGWELPNARYAFSHFEVSTFSNHGFLIEFPLWCLILPCTIAPILWLRRHRRRTPRGFAVEPAKQVPA